MKAIEKLKIIEQEMKLAKEWIGLIGKKCGNPGDHYGRLKPIILYTPEIDYQEYCGSKNYHEIPNYLHEHLNKIINNNYRKFLDEAFLALEEDLKNAKKDALSEYENLKSDLEGK